MEFNTEFGNAIRKHFLDGNGLYDLVKEKASLSVKGSLSDQLLTNRKYFLNFLQILTPLKLVLVIIIMWSVLC